MQTYQSRIRPVRRPNAILPAFAAGIVVGLLIALVAT
jgi:hypothetical protein